MTFIDALTALVLITVFLSGFSQVFMPVFHAWKMAAAVYSAARTIRFVSESFTAECAKPDRDMEKWEKTVSVAKELESYEIRELRQDGKIRALKFTGSIAGEQIEIVGLCER